MLICFTAIVLGNLLPMPTAVVWVGRSAASISLSVFPHHISKTDAAMITKLDIRHGPLRVIETHFGVQRSMVKVMRQWVRAFFEWWLLLVSSWWHKTIYILKSNCHGVWPEAWLTAGSRNRAKGDYNSLLNILLWKYSLPLYNCHFCIAWHLVFLMETQHKWFQPQNSIPHFTSLATKN